MSNSRVERQQLMLTRFCVDMFYHLNMLVKRDAGDRGMPKDIMALPNLLHDQGGAAFLFAMLLRTGYFNTLLHLNRDDRVLVRARVCCILCTPYFVSRRSPWNWCHH
jgi:hypothetical protein